MRAIGRSALALLVARVGADDPDPPVPADHLALLTHRLHTRSNLHVCSFSSLLGFVSVLSLLFSSEAAVVARGRALNSASLVPVGDPAPRQVVGRDLHLHSVAGEDPDPVHPHLS